MLATGVARRFLVVFIVIFGLVSIHLVFTRRAAADDAPLKDNEDLRTSGQEHRDAPTGPGRAIAPKLANATAKAELGRSAWKVLHTTFARFPDKPSKEEKEALKSYIYLFQRLYPCGECSEHFSQLLKKFPPQVSSRSAAAGWGCHVHNEVNKKLHKELFDCATIGDFYDCGCGDDDKKGKGKSGDAETEEEDKPVGKSGKVEMSEERKEKFGREMGRAMDDSAFRDRRALRLEREGYQRGG